MMVHLLIDFSVPPDITGIKKVLCKTEGIKFFLRISILLGRRFHLMPYGTCCLRRGI
jgi:hypothetical protein